MNNNNNYTEKTSFHNNVLYRFLYYLSCILDITYLNIISFILQSNFNWIGSDKNWKVVFTVINY